MFDRPGLGWHIPLLGKFMLNLTKPYWGWISLGADIGFIEEHFHAQFHIGPWHPYLEWEGAL